MIKKIIQLFFFISLTISVFGIEEGDTTKTTNSYGGKIYGPTIGLGVGILKFYGDVSDANYGNPLIGNFGYDIYLKQRLNSFLTGKVYFIFGKLSANERSIDRNLNFESKITVSGLSFAYDFSHFIPKNKSYVPFVSLGIESVEFRSKTDLFDQFGNEYNYWSDGSIRNLPENDLNSGDAIVIQRDYFFETDLRESNFDDLGKYPERTFALPVGAGVTLRLSEHIDFTLKSTMHFAFTDLIDNVVEESAGERIGNRSGNAANDRFWFNSFSINYNFMRHDEKVNYFDNALDYMIYADQDEDQDGVNDFIDRCPWTPSGVDVDSTGCPLDDDDDLVANYKDDELETRANVPVSPNGVELTDSMIYLAYQRYIDSTGLFAEVVNRSIKAKFADEIKNFRVQIGQYTETISADLVDKFLSIPDVEIQSFGDTSIVIVVGNYDNLPEAVKRKIRLNQEGYNAIVVQQGKNGTYTSVGDDANNMDVSSILMSDINSQGLIFRIQLGAFSAKLSESSFNGLKNITVLKIEGLYKYLYRGSFKTMEEAAAVKINLAINYGVQDAFIVAYKDGKRISLKEAGVHVNPSIIEEKIPENNRVYNKSAIKYQVQLGSYKNTLSEEVLSQFVGIEGIEQLELGNGLIRYTTGNFKTYYEAAVYRNKLIGKGFDGVFIIALDGQELIPVSKAKEILGE